MRTRIKMFARIVLVAAIVLSSIEMGSAQAVPPTVLKGTAKTIETTLPTPSSCNDTNYFNGLVPLSTKSRTDDDVVCFWGASGQLAPLAQVQYLYGFDEGTNTISVDMLSFQFKAPVGAQVSLGTSVTAGGSSNSNTGQPSAQVALASLEAGGNFYLHVLYPLAAYRTDSIRFLATLNSKVGFSIQGFAGQSTLSQGTEQYVSFPGEMYFEYAGIGNKGGVYADYRGGLESVPGSFKKATGLPSNVFALQQVSFGFSLGSLLRIGTQRFIGPAAGFNAPTTADFNKWHLVLQLSPSGK